MSIALGWPLLLEQRKTGCSRDHGRKRGSPKGSEAHSCPSSVFLLLQSQLRLLLSLPRALQTSSNRLPIELADGSTRREGHRARSSRHWFVSFSDAFFQARFGLADFHLFALSRGDAFFTSWSRSRALLEGQSCLPDGRGVRSDGSWK